MLGAFLLFLAIFTLIGIASARYSRGTKADYYLASRQIQAWLVGLSAVATNNSGYMFIGVIGYTYVTGLAAFWLMFGWIFGDFLASLFVHKKLRHAAETTDRHTYPGVLSFWGGKHHWNLRRLMGLIAFVFLMVYASAQLVAGSKALYALFDWPLWAGAVMGTALIIAYCMAGGIRASIWTDAAQSVVMITAMTILLLSAIDALGGLNQTVSKLTSIPGFADLLPSDMLLPGLAGLVLFIVGWIFAGLSVIGQPHVMIRFMALEDLNKMRRAKLWYYGWFTAFYSAATGVGLLSRLLLPEVNSFDAELALPTMAQDLLHPWLVGLILAAIFAATMSTADSLVLTCSSVVTSDIFKQKISSPLVVRSATVGIALGALALALFNKESVFHLVVFSWSGLASAFAPLLIARCLGWTIQEKTAIVAMLIGLIVALSWRMAGFHNAIYEGLPGILSGIFVLTLVHLQTKKNR